VNEQIRARSVMVIDNDGQQLGVLPIAEAREQAAAADLDLVEVSPNSEPPVCKIMDFGKFLYRQNKKAHDAKKKQKVIKIKEVKTTPNTEEHDYQFKLAHAKRFLEHGDKVKVTVFFRGRQIAHAELGQKIIDRFVEDLSGFAVVEQEPERMGKTLSLVLAPARADGKGGMKKITEESEQEVAESQPAPEQNA